jgi:hypothetical protein
MKSPVFENHLRAMLRDSRAGRLDSGQRKEKGKLNVPVDGGGRLARGQPDDGN